MIIETLLNTIIGLFETLLDFVHIPQISADLLQSADTTIDNIFDFAVNLLNLALPYNVARTMLLIVIAVELAVDVYLIIIWVLKKLPMLGIE